MSWRVVVVTGCAKVDYKMDYVVVRSIDHVRRVHISEIAVLMFENTAISVTAYAQFRKRLIQNGFLMLQESVYSKLALNMNAARAVMETVRRDKPEKGLVQMLVVTEKQYARMEYVVGEFHSEVVDTDERTLFL